MRGSVDGGIAFYYRDDHVPDAIDVKIAQALGHLAAAAISSAELHAEQQALQQAAVKAAARARLLAEISEHLSSLDDRKSLESLATLTVPSFADWCIVDLLDDEGVLRQLSVVHVDPERVAFARAYSERYALQAGPPVRGLSGPALGSVHSSRALDRRGAGGGGARFRATGPDALARPALA